ncbi:LacI family DNA-binding transcriptional regulator [Arthrobacter sp. NPDC090010]|uniref:LacI family DNA-binding transcriptional regulator n=1 Tax=Arthrobacter sp. NPDC090010 TaxID=3363942 RepID=UPI00382A23BE
MRTRVTREDVAREAGTSVAVVSYVINDGPRPVSKALREKVLAAIDKTGYQPNSIAQSLARGSSNTYGFVVPNITNPFIASIAHALEERVFAGKGVLLLGDSADDKGRELEIIRNFLSRQVDGIIYMGVDQDLHLDVIKAAGTPVVVFTHAHSDGVTASVRVDERAAGEAGTQHLIQHGYRRIGLIAGPTHMMNTWERLAGWQAALSATDTAQAGPIEHAEYSRDGGYAAATLMTKVGPLPDAVFASNERQALGALAAFCDAGFRVPDDVALLCFNGTGEARFSVPSLATIEQPVAEMAARALDILRDPKAYDVGPVGFDFELVPRASCGCPNRR